MDQRIIDLYDDYTHRPLDRRVFLERLAALVGAGGVGAALAALEPNAAAAQTIAPADPRIEASRTSVPGPAGAIAGYLARPMGAARAPALIVIHENRGLNAHIEDVARRAAVAGFLALAPDLLSRKGGTPADADAARALFADLREADTVADLRAVLAHLRSHPSGNGRVGAVGFCWGGGAVNGLAVAAPDLDAGVVFYGRSPNPEAVAGIKAAMQLHYAGLDTRINEGVPSYVAALKAAGVRHEMHLYEGTQHAFHNDTSAERHNRAAAELAWSRTVAFLKEKLGG